MPANQKKQDPKRDALKKAGTLNPHSEKVIDELFRSGEFFDARDMMQVKYEMLRRVKEDGWSISEAAKVFGFSRSSLYQAEADFERVGLVSFIPQRRGPRAAHKLSGTVVKFIDELKQQDHLVRTSELVKLIKQQFGIDVHRRSIERAMTRAKKKL
jgi:transposase